MSKIHDTAAILLGPVIAVAAVTCPSLLALGNRFLQNAPQTGQLIGSNPWALNSLLAFIPFTLGICIGLASAVLVVYHRPLSRRVIHLSLFGLLLELFYRFAYDGPISAGLLLSVPETSRRETIELLAGHVALTISLSLVAALLGASVLFSWRSRSRFAMRACALGATVAVLLIATSMALNMANLRRPALALQATATDLVTLFPFDLANAIVAVGHEWFDTRRQASSRAAFTFPQVHLTDMAKRQNDTEIYVFVVGETSRRSNWSLFGYQRQTTPRLDAIKSELITFDHVTSNATNTILSLPLALTRASPADRKRAHSERSILGLLGQAGFKTFWLSNQEPPDTRANPIGQIAQDAQSVSYAADLPLDQQEGGLDSNLTTRLAALIKSASRGAKLAIVLHMEGSHFGYKDRYPPAFRQFPDKKPAPRVLNDWQSKLLDEYDNSVYYTDYNVRAIIDLMASCACKAGLIFFSDHGERLFDTGISDNQFGHGFPDVSRQEIEIPFFVWLSNQYRVTNPAAIKILRGNAGAPAELHNLFETIVDLAAIQYSMRDSTLSMFSDQRIPPEQREVLTLQQTIVTMPID